MTLWWECGGGTKCHKTGNAEKLVRFPDIAPISFLSVRRDRFSGVLDAPVGLPFGVSQLASTRWRQIPALQETACECYQAVKLNYDAYLHASNR